MSNVKGQGSKVTRPRIYLDYASTTPLDPRVRKAMEPFFAKEFGNPSSIHAEGVAAKMALDAARTSVARCLEAHADEIVFTSGGTEANNLAILGVLTPPPRLPIGGQAFQGGDKKGGRKENTPLSLPLERGEGNTLPHVVITNIEHSSVLEPLRELERRGEVQISYVPVEQNGIVKPEKILAAIKPSTVLVSVMYANNEIGTVQPIKKIAAQIKDLRLKLKGRRQELTSYNLHLKSVENRFPIFHSDACQAPLYLHCLVNALGVDLLTLDGHKMYGLKGVGCLYVRRNMPLAAQVLGGGQERGLRSTTENVAGIVGFAEALRIAVAERERESTRIAQLRDHLCAVILKNISIAVVNGSMEKGERLPNNLNISLPGIDTEFLTLRLDAAGIAVSTKSSCLKDEKESYVVKALLGSIRRASATLRFTLGRGTTKGEIEYTAKTLADCSIPNIESDCEVV